MAKAPHFIDNVSPHEKKRFSKFLAEDEELILSTGYSKLYLRQRFMFYVLLPGSLLILIFLGVAYFLDLNLYLWVGIGTFLAIILAFLKTYHINLSHRYLLTTRRVLLKKGYFAVKLTSALYDKITHIEVEQGFVDRMFLNHGTIIINTAGSNRDEMVLEYVESPVEFKNILERLINREREQYSRQSGPVVSLEGELVE